MEKLNGGVDTGRELPLPATQDPPDVHISIEGKTIACHRQVLSKHSHYFKAMFTSPMKESHQDVIHLRQVSVDMFTALVDFAYTGKIIVQAETVYDLLSTASMLQFTEVTSTCVAYLHKQIHHDNCLEVMVAADNCGANSLYNHARQWALWNFSQVTTSESFLDYSSEIVCDYVQEDLLNITSELAVFDALVAWLEYDKDARQEEFYRLLQYVRCPCLTESEQEVVKSHPVIRNSAKCLECINQNLTQTGKKVRQVPRVLRVLGSHCSLPSLEDSKTSKQGAPMPVELLQVDKQKPTGFKHISSSQLTQPLPQGCTATVVGCDLYISGGEQEMGRNSWCMDLWKYDGLQDTWDIVTRLPQPRRHHSAVAWEDGLCLIGGCGRYRIITDSVVHYDPQAGVWNELPALLQPIFSAAAAVCRQRIYVIKNHMEYFCQGASQWTKLETTLPYASGIRYCGALSNNLCLAEPHRIIVFDPQTSTSLQSHKLPDLVDLKIAICDTDVYGLHYSMGYSETEQCSRLTLALHRWEKGTEHWDNHLQLLRPDLKVTFIFSMPVFPNFRENSEVNLPAVT